MEGILRINPKNYEDGYICAADNGQDILIQVIFECNVAVWLS